MKYFEKGKPPAPHKEGCACFRCSGVAWNKGIKRWWDSPTEFKKGKHYSRATEFHRKGDRLGYFGLHEWVYKKLGRATTCFICGSIYGIEWANLSHEYHKRIADWRSLCRICHKRYDREFGWGKATSKYPELRRGNHAGH